MKKIKKISALIAAVAMAVIGIPSEGLSAEPLPPVWYYLETSGTFGKGDINGDGKVSEEDAKRLQKYIVNSYCFSDSNQAESDINLDGVVDVFDYSLMRRDILTQNDREGIEWSVEKFPEVDLSEEFFSDRETGFVMTSQAELEQFLVKYLRGLTNDICPNPAEELMKSYLEKYDVAFFEKNVLLLKPIIQTMCDEVLYNITRIYYENDTLNIDYRFNYDSKSSYEQVVLTLMAQVSVPKSRYHADKVTWNYSEKDYKLGPGSCEPPDPNIPEEYPEISEYFDYSKNCADEEERHLYVKQTTSCDNKGKNGKTRIVFSKDKNFSSILETVTLTSPDAPYEPFNKPFNKNTGWITPPIEYLPGTPETFGGFYDTGKLAFKLDWFDDKEELMVTFYVEDKTYTYTFLYAQLDGVEPLEETFTFSSGDKKRSLYVKQTSYKPENKDGKTRIEFSKDKDFTKVLKTVKLTSDGEAYRPFNNNGDWIDVDAAEGDLSYPEIFADKELNFSLYWKDKEVVVNFTAGDKTYSETFSYDQLDDIPQLTEEFDFSYNASADTTYHIYVRQTSCNPNAADAWTNIVIARDKDFSDVLDTVNLSCGGDPYKPFNSNGNWIRVYSPEGEHIPVDIFGDLGGNFEIYWLENEVKVTFTAGNKNYVYKYSYKKLDGIKTPEIVDETGEIPDNAKFAILDTVSQKYPDSDLSDFKFVYNPEHGMQSSFTWCFNVYYKDILLHGYGDINTSQNVYAGVHKDANGNVSAEVELLYEPEVYSKVDLSEERITKETAINTFGAANIPYDEDNLERIIYIHMDDDGMDMPTLAYRDKVYDYEYIVYPSGDSYAIEHIPFDCFIDCYE